MRVGWFARKRFGGGRICSSDKIVSTPTEKAELFRQTGALAVDMESDRVRKWAGENGIPFIGIRAISDTADEALDPAVVGLVDEMGDQDRCRLLRCWFVGRDWCLI